MELLDACLFVGCLRSIVVGARRKNKAMMSREAKNEADLECRSRAKNTMDPIRARRSIDWLFSIEYSPYPSHKTIPTGEIFLELSLLLLPCTCHTW